jgi:hypothetical protein
MSDDRRMTISIDSLDEDHPIKKISENSTPKSKTKTKSKETPPASPAPDDSSREKASESSPPSSSSSYSTTSKIEEGTEGSRQRKWRQSGKNYSSTQDIKEYYQKLAHVSPKASTEEIDEEST